MTIKTGRMPHGFFIYHRKEFSMNEEVKELAEKVMAKFRDLNYQVDDILQSQMVRDIRLSLTPPENKIYDDAIQHLVNNNYITVEGSEMKEQYRLTQAGYNHIYNPNTQGA
jgi:hypothetical protein